MRPVPGFDGYFATDDGQIVSTRGGAARRLKSSISSIRYRSLKARGPAGKFVTHYIHRLVAMAYHGLPVAGQQVRHLDGNSMNNSPENLAWGNSFDNAADMKRHGRTRAGVKNPNVRLTPAQVIEIRKISATGLSCKKIGKAYGVSPMTVNRIARRVLWKNIAEGGAA